MEGVGTGSVGAAEWSGMNGEETKLLDLGW